MNFYDSTRMEDLLLPMGYRMVDTPAEAALVILNTCHIREKAAEKVYSDLGRLRPHKQRKADKGEQMLIAVAGCVGQAEGEEITRRAPYVDMVVGPQTYHQLPDLIGRALRQSKDTIALEFDVQEKFDALPVPEPANIRRQTQAFLTIQEGCDKFCTFCVVPYTRGAEFSRPVAAIVEEAKRLVDAGAVEISLLGQNVNAYHGEGLDGKEWGLGRLIRELADRVPEIARIRYSTSHPRDMDDELIMAHGDVPQLMPFLHLPVQSGSDAILQKMNRKHTAHDYRKIIEKLRVVRPDISFSSDFIVGFPGETAQDFEDTLQLVRDVTFAQAYSFKYSMRPGTPAANVEDQLSEEEKSERLARLMDLLNEQQRRYNTSFVGKTIPVLIEKPGKYAGDMAGRSAYMQLVHLADCHLPVGALVDVRVTKALSHSMLGDIVSTTMAKAA